MSTHDLSTRLKQAQTLLQTGQPHEAWLIVAPLRQSIDADGQALRVYARAARADSHFDAAIEALKRIAVLEGDLPDIMGSIATTYGKAGQHAEAYEHWSAMAVRHPAVVEAHLNRAIAASSAEMHDQAVEATQIALKLFPGDGRVIATKASILKTAGRIEESVKAFAAAVAADPERPMVRRNQGLALRAACRMDDACDSFASAERLGMSGAEFYVDWAAAALEAQRVDEAEDLYLKALKDDPLHDEARKGLTRLRIEFQGGERAFEHYEQAARRSPSDPRAWFEWSKALMSNRQTAAALEVAERGLAANPASWELMAASAFGRGMLGDAAAALDELDSLLREQPIDSPLQSIITQIALRAGRPDRAAEVLEAQTARDPADQFAWSMLGIAWRLLGDPREHWLCDYDRLIMITDVVPPEGADSATEYAREVAAFLDPLHLAMSEPGDQTLRRGTQSNGSLFSRQDPATQRFREAVTLAAERAVAQLPDDPTHPFLGRKSTRLGFSGSWSIRLRAGGHHVPHIHPGGWMSSAYYARLPDGCAEDQARHEGWIEFGVPPEHLGLEAMESRRIVEPKPGRLVLFPSYLWHGTIPFASGDRLTAAFDYQPL